VFVFYAGLLNLFGISCAFYFHATAARLEMQVAATNKNKIAPMSNHHTPKS
jgi:hypothetical protein